MSKQGKRSSRKKGNPTAPVSLSSKKDFRPLGICVALCVITLAVFWSVSRDEFVNLDDQVYVTGNAHVQQGLTWSNVAWAFTNLNAGFWHPLTWLSIMLDCQFFRLWAGGHHLTSLMLHAANTVLLFIVLRRMTVAMWRSAFVAALFALHPLHVETVAWAADRKDVLSTLFWMLTMLMYVRYVEAAGHQNNTGGGGNSFRKNSKSSRVWYSGTMVCFACAIMSKTMVVTLPLVLLLLDWWPLGRFKMPDRKRMILDKLPFFAISLAAGLLTIHAESGVGALQGADLFPLQFRAANAVLSCWRYLAQLFWPAELAVFYPYTESFSVLSVAGATLCLGIITVLVLLARRKAPYLAVGWFWFLVTLLPVIGFIQVGAHARADRYTYVPLIGIFLLLTWGVCDLTKRLRNQAAVLTVVGSAALLACIILTRLQLAVWQTSETLFRHALEVTRGNYVASYCLGLYLSDHGDNQDAVKYYRQALEINPEYGEAYSNLGIEVAMAGNINEAIDDFRKAIRFNPRLAGAHSNLGLALAMQHKLDEATIEYRESLKINPDDGRVHSNLGQVLDEQGKREEAVNEYHAALQLDPNNPELHVNLGITLAGQGKRSEAITQFTEALRLKPDDAEAQQALDKLKSSGNPAVR